MEGHGRARNDPHAGLTARSGRAARGPLRTRIALAAILIEAAAAAVWLAAPVVRSMRRSWSSRVAIAGGSMDPTLLPGDWVLVDPDAYRARRPRVGELVLVSDPRHSDRLLVKRVASYLPDGGLEVVGDAAEASTDSRTFGPVDAATVAGRPWFRYWPPARIGPIR